MKFTKIKYLLLTALRGSVTHSAVQEHAVITTPFLSRVQINPSTPVSDHDRFSPYYFYNVVY